MEGLPQADYRLLGILLQIIIQNFVKYILQKWENMKKAREYVGAHNSRKDHIEWWLIEL